MKCDMHNFWVWVYDRTEYAHRDPVANIVIYSAFALFGSFLGLVFGVPAFVALSELHPCNGMNHKNDPGINSTLDTCHFIMAFSLAVYTMIVSAIGITSGELHKPLIYSVFGGLGFVAFWAELYSFSSLITMIVMRENRMMIQAMENKDTINALCGIATGGHGIALYCTFMAVRYAWKVNFHFTHQEKLVFAEHLRQQRYEREGKAKDGKFGVAEIDDDHEFSVGGMEKGLRKMFEDKARIERRVTKQQRLQQIEEEEDQRVIDEQKGNLF